MKSKYGMVRLPVFKFLVAPPSLSVRGFLVHIWRILDCDEGLCCARDIGGWLDFWTSNTDHLVH